MLPLLPPIKRRAHLGRYSPLPPWLPSCGFSRSLTGTSWGVRGRALGGDQHLPAWPPGDGASWLWLEFQVLSGPPPLRGGVSANVSRDQHGPGSMPTFASMAGRTTRRSRSQVAPSRPRGIPQHFSAGRERCPNWDGPDWPTLCRGDVRKTSTSFNSSQHGPAVNAKKC